MTERHLAIVWSNGQRFEQKLLMEIRSKFTIAGVSKMTWPAGKFAENLSRFYGRKLANLSHKVRQCGTGAFTIIIFDDESPLYGERQTTRGAVYLNSRVFDLKLRLRAITGGGTLVHGSNTPDEVRHDASILFGPYYESVVNGGQRELEEGCQYIFDGGWPDLNSLFRFLNNTSSYIILRNFYGGLTGMADGPHPDIDLLVENVDEVSMLLGAKKRSLAGWRRNYEVQVGQRGINLDLRTAGDGYYDAAWAANALKNRVYNLDGVYVPSVEDEIYMTHYHGSIHKRTYSPDYLARINAIANDIGLQEADRSAWDDRLFSYMKERGYKVVEPNDLSVGFNFRRDGFFTSDLSLKRRLFSCILAVKRSAIRNR